MDDLQQILQNLVVDIFPLFSFTAVLRMHCRLRRLLSSREWKYMKNLAGEKQIMQHSFIRKKPTQTKTQQKKPQKGENNVGDLDVGRSFLST